MKVFIILTTYLAVTLASENHQQHPAEDFRYDGRFGYADLKIGHNGVPIDTPEVQQAREDHLAAIAKALAAHAEWAAKNNAKKSYDSWTENNEVKSSHEKWANNNQVKLSQVEWAGNPDLYEDKNAWSNLNSHVDAHDIKYDGRYGYIQPQIGHNGVPIETPEVQQARDYQLSSLPEAKASHVGWTGDAGSYGGRYGSANSNYLNPHNNIKYDGRYGYAHIKIGDNGVPLDTPEVQHAKAAHLTTLSEAKATHSDWNPQTNDHERHRRDVSEVRSKTHLKERPVIYAEIGPDGLPLDTPEIIALKQAHLAAHASTLALIEKQRKSPIWSNDQYDNGFWKDDTAWKNVETSTSNIWNNVGRRNKGYNNNGRDNQGFEWKNLEPATSRSNQNLESGPHTKVTVKTKGWNNVESNVESKNNKANSVLNSEAYNINAWINESSKDARNNQVFNNIAWKNLNPATSRNNQRLESSPHTKITWKNNPWSNEDINVWSNIESTTSHSNQNLGSYEHGNDRWNHSASSETYRPYKGPFHIPKIHNGVPEYTPEVQLAREQHLAALAYALAKAPVYKPQKQEYSN